MTTKTKNPARERGEKQKAAREREAFLAHERASVTAAAWVSCIRVKVREITSQAAKLENILGNPTQPDLDLRLRCCLDAGGVRNFITAAFALEECLDGLLANDAEPGRVYDLVGACRAAADADRRYYGPLIAAKQKADKAAAKKAKAPAAAAG